MAILQKLKSLLGLEPSGSDRDGSREVGVTVEREASDPGASDVEHAPATDDPAAAGTTASGSTDSITEPTDEPHEAAEPAEATGPTESDAAPTAEKTPAQRPADDEADETAPEPVDDIKGIGPAYADRLADADVETVADLAAADAKRLADETDISEKRIQGWIDRAEVRQR